LKSSINHLQTLNQDPARHSRIYRRMWPLNDSAIVSEWGSPTSIG